MKKQNHEQQKLRKVKEPERPMTPKEQAEHDKLVAKLSVGAVSLGSALFLAQMFSMLNMDWSVYSVRYQREQERMAAIKEALATVDMNDPANLQKLQELIAKLHPDHEQLVMLSETYQIPLDVLTALEQKANENADVIYTYDDQEIER